MSYADTQPGPDGWGPPRRHGDHPQGWTKKHGGEVPVGGLFRLEAPVSEPGGLHKGYAAGSRIFRKTSEGKARDTASQLATWVFGPTPVWVPVNAGALEHELRRRGAGRGSGKGLDFSSVFVPLAAKRVRHERF